MTPQQTAPAAAMLPHIPQYSFPAQVQNPQWVYAVPPNMTFVPMNSISPNQTSPIAMPYAPVLAGHGMQLPQMYQNTPFMQWSVPFAQPTPFMAPSSGGIYFPHAAGYNPASPLYYPPVDPSVAMTPAPALDFLNNSMPAQSSATPALGSVMPTQPNAMSTLPSVMPALPMAGLVSAQPAAMGVPLNTTPALGSAMPSQPNAMPTLLSVMPPLPMASLVSAQPAAMGIPPNTTSALKNMPPTLHTQPGAIPALNDAPSEQPSTMPTQSSALLSPMSAQHTYSSMPSQSSALPGPSSMSGRAPSVRHSGHAYPSPMASLSSDAKTKSKRNSSATSAATRSMSRGNTRESGPYAKPPKTSNDTDAIPPPRRAQLVTIGDVAKVEFAIQRLVRGPALCKDFRTCRTFIDAIETATTDERKYVPFTSIPC